VILATLAAIEVYPSFFGATLTKVNHGTNVLFSAQGLEIYVLVLAIAATVWLSKRDAKVKSGAPYSYVKKAAISFSLTFFLVAAGVLLGFACYWVSLII
jgi:hypothetical protein